MTRPRPNAGYRDGKTIRRWASYAKPDATPDDAIVQEDRIEEELNPRPIGQATETKIAPDPTAASIIDNSRPDLPDENADGLDPLTAEVIRVVEETPRGTGGPPPGLEEQPVEPKEAIDNQGEFPGLADQGEEGPKPVVPPSAKKGRKAK
jgi:hypothetical protein